MKLIYVHYVGQDWKKDNIYDFIFSNEDDLNNIEGKEWDCHPACGNPEVPSSDYISEVKTILTDCELELIQNNTIFCMNDVKHGIISLAWEELDESEIIKNRMVFKFGDELSDVKQKLYQNEIVFIR